MPELGDVVRFMIRGTTMHQVGMVLSFPLMEKTNEDTEEQEMIEVCILVRGEKHIPPKADYSNWVYEYYDTNNTIYIHPDDVIDIVECVILEDKHEKATDIISNFEKESIYVLYYIDEEGVKHKALSVDAKLTWIHFNPLSVIEILNGDIVKFDTNSWDTLLIHHLKSLLFDKFVSALSSSRQRFENTLRWNEESWIVMLKRACNIITDTEYIIKMDSIQLRPKNREVFYAFDTMSPVILCCLREWLLGDRLLYARDAYDGISYQSTILDEILEEYEREQESAMSELTDYENDKDDKSGKEGDDEEIDSFVTDDRSSVTSEPESNSEEELSSDASCFDSDVTSSSSVSNSPAARKNKPKWESRDSDEDSAYEP